MPFGILSSITSPWSFPIKALANGEVIEIFPILRSASSSPTNLYVTFLPSSRLINNTVDPNITFVDTGITASITPSSTSSKILILVDGQGFESNTAARGFNTNVMRGSTQIVEFDKASSYGPEARSVTNNTGVNWLDSPSSTSAVTYKVQVRRHTGSDGTIYAQANSCTSTITLMEIKG